MKKEKQKPCGKQPLRLEGLRAVHLTKTEHPAADGYLYRGDGLSFPDEDSLQLFLNTYGGIIIPTDKGRYEVWCYNGEHIVVTSPQEYRSLPFSEKTVYSDGKCVAKVRLNQLTKTVTLYTL